MFRAFISHCYSKNRKLLRIQLVGGWPFGYLQNASDELNSGLTRTNPDSARLEGFEIERPIPLDHTASIFLYYEGVFEKTIIPLPLVEYWLIIYIISTSPRALNAPKRSWNNCQIIKMATQYSFSDPGTCKLSSEFSRFRVCYVNNLGDEQQVKSCL